MKAKCPKCKGRLQATVEQFFTLFGRDWDETLAQNVKLYCTGDCAAPLDLDTGQLPEAADAVEMWSDHVGVEAAVIAATGMTRDQIAEMVREEKKTCS